MSRLERGIRLAGGQVAARVISICQSPVTIRPPPGGLFVGPDIEAGLDMSGVGRFEMYRTVVIVATIRTAIKIPVRAEKTKRVFIKTIPARCTRNRTTELSFPKSQYAFGATFCSVLRRSRTSEGNPGKPE